MCRYKIVLLAVLMVGTCGLRATVNIEGMVPRNPKPFPSHVGEVTYQNGKWILGSETGTLSHSEDGLNWSTVALPYGKGVTGVTYWKGWYMALGVDSRTLMRSMDLVNWLEEHPANFLFNPKHFLEYDGKLYVVGWSPGLAYTEDGVTWTEVDVLGEQRLNGIASDGSRLVATGNDGKIFTSEDGMEWIQRQASIEGKEGIDDDFMYATWLGAQFIACGKEGLLMTSPDGIDWTLVDAATSDWFFGVVLLEGNFYFTGRQGKLHRTSDFQDWTVVETGITSTINDIHMGESSLLVGGRDGYVALSEDGETWELTDGGPREYLFELEYGADVFVAADASGGIWKSNDSEGWVKVHEVANERNLKGLVFDGTQFVGISSNGLLLTSPDGETWTESPGLEGSPARMRLIDGTCWLVGNDGLVASSTNLADWTVSSAGSEDLLDIAYGNGRFVVVGRDGTLLHSANGTDWTPYETGETNDLKTVAFANGTFVVLGRSSILLTSTDGLAWESRGLAGVTPYDALRLEFIDGEFVAVGYLGNCGTSENGTDWSTVRARVSQSLYDIVYAADRTVAVGTAGTILSSRYILSGGYEEWAAVRFSPAEFVDPAISGPLADPDQDRRINAFEFFSNTPPLVKNAGPPFSTYLLEVDGQYYQAVDIVRRTEIAGAGFNIWKSGNLSAWEHLLDDQIILVSQSPLDEDSEILQYRLAEPVSQSTADFITASISLD